MTDFKAIFHEQLAERNAAQRQAIETINGPVMVIAGPGTGKTDVLGLRVGNILEQTQASIQHILCLTFTEAGAMEMRRRLHQYIGPTAYNAQIYTFHGFCNMVIHEHLEKFGVFREAQPVSDLEQFQILRAVIDEQPLDHPLKRLTGQIYFEARRLKNLYDVMKMERWSVADMHTFIDNWIREKQESSEFIYKKSSPKFGYQKGDLKVKDFTRKVEKPMTLLRAAVDTFDLYNKKLREAGRYDYQDMLTWVHDAFASDADMLASYQERYLYFHVDEFQDTNGIQLALLNLLAGHWERPDVFVVGDDDQSIFRFQGANMHNITQFKQMYDPEVIVLTENYRSSQHILDAAGALIKHNEERLVAQYPEYTKNLTANGPSANSAVEAEVRTYPNWTQEQASILAEISELHHAGVLESETVAIIYRRHRQVEDLVHIMEVRDIPLNVKKPVNILNRPLIKNILAIFRYIALEIEQVHTGEYLLFEIMQYPYFGISHLDSGKIAIGARGRGLEGRTPWREITGSEKLLRHLNVDRVEEVLTMDRLLTSWIQDFHQLTIQELFEQLLTKGGLFQWIFDHPNRSWHLQIVKTFMDFLKKESMRTPGLSLQQLLENIALMVDNRIELPVYKILNAPHGVHFVTAHSAKGMQFERVYMIGCTKDVWDETGRGRGDKFTLPDLVPSSGEENDEDERRLFYVGMTRAKSHLTISYALQNDDEREMEASRFVGELIDSETVKQVRRELSENAFVLYCRDLFKPVEVQTPLIEPALLREELDAFVLSVSALNKYLECPRKFYFENILKIPSANKTYFGFGNAIHTALEQFIIWSVADHQVTRTAEELGEMFRKEIRKYKSYFTDQEYEGHRHHGYLSLLSYHAQRADSWKLPDICHTEYNVQSLDFQGVPIRGFVDRVDEYSDYLEVVDYKTGKRSSARKYGQLNRPSEKDAAGGKYWRQIVFYKLLLEAEGKFKKPVVSGYLDFIQAGSDGQHALEKFVISEEDVAIVTDQIKTVYQSIMDGKFQEGCRDPQCYWCNLVENQMQFDPARAMPRDEEIQ